MTFLFCCEAILIFISALYMVSMRNSARAIADLVEEAIKQQNEQIVVANRVMPEFVYLKNEMKALHTRVNDFNLD